MKATRLYTLLALLLMAGRVTLQAQESFTPERIYSDSNTLLCSAAKAKDGYVFVGCENGSGKGKLVKVNLDEQVSEKLFQPEENASFGMGNIASTTSYLVAVYTASCPSIDGKSKLFMTVFNHGLEEISTKVIKEYDKRLDAWPIQVLLDKDDTFVVCFQNTNNNVADIVELMRVDMQGDLIAEKELHFNVEVGFFEGFHSLVHNADSTGYYLGSDMFYGACLTELDKDFDVVTGPNLFSLELSDGSTPLMLNCSNGYVYCFGRAHRPAMNGWPLIYDNHILYKLDANMQQLDYALTEYHGVEDVAEQLAADGIDYTDEGRMVFAGILDATENYPGYGLFVGNCTMDLDDMQELYYIDEQNAIGAQGIYSTEDGDCLIFAWERERGQSQQEYDMSIFHIPAEAFLGVEEAHANGLKVAIAYPNPGHDVLNIRTALPDARVEVYDANGRLVHSQGITENVTSIDAEAWAEGVYVWKVYSSNKETESGKWIKE